MTYSAFTLILLCYSMFPRFCLVKNLYMHLLSTKSLPSDSLTLGQVGELPLNGPFPLEAYLLVRETAIHQIIAVQSCYLRKCCELEGLGGDQII